MSEQDKILKEIQSTLKNTQDKVDLLKKMDELEEIKSLLEDHISKQATDKNYQTHMKECIPRKLKELKGKDGQSAMKEALIACAKEWRERGTKKDDSGQVDYGQGDFGKKKKPDEDEEKAGVSGAAISAADVTGSGDYSGKKPDSANNPKGFGTASTALGKKPNPHSKTQEPTAYVASMTPQGKTGVGMNQPPIQVSNSDKDKEKQSIRTPQ